MRYLEQLEIVQTYNVQSGQTNRINCPFCGGKKTLSITKRDGKLIWNCFKASCEASGIQYEGRSQSEIKHYLAGRNQVVLKKTPEIPEIQSDIKNHPRAVEYLKKVNSFDAYEKKAIKISYAPTEDRVLFFNSDRTGCVGRTLKEHVRPKWKAYGEFNSLLSVGNQETAVLVEDAASACAVYATNQFTGVALLGTHLSFTQRNLLKQYKSLIVCLDKDASKKAIYLRSQLIGVTECRIVFLTRDLKMYQPDEVKRILCNANESESRGPS
jgi:ribosomal protein L37AE/L43A